MKTANAGIIHNTTPASTVATLPVPRLPCSETSPSGRVKFSSVDGQDQRAEELVPVVVEREDAIPRISMNTGTIVTCIGTIIVASTTPNRRVSPRNSIRANT